MAMTTRFLAVGEVADYFSDRYPGSKLQSHHVRRLYARRLLPEPPRMRGQRVIAEADLPAVEQALRQAGYLKGEG